MEDSIKKLVVKINSVVIVFGYILFAVEFPELLNHIFKTNVFGDGWRVVSLISFGLLAVYSYGFKQEGYK